MLSICEGVDLSGSFVQKFFFFDFFVRDQAMSSLSRELVFLILQFLDEEKFKETVHKYAYFSLILLTIFFYKIFV